jgi:DNA modification methylase
MKADKKSKGKTLESLEESQVARAAFITEFGCVPESIMTHDPSDKAIDLQVEDGGRDYIQSTGRTAKELKTTVMRKAFETSGRTCRGKGGGLSRFPQNVGRQLLKLYSEKGDKIFDPFSGHNSRMQLCYQAQRNYVGCDVSHNFMEDNRKIKEMLLNETKNSFNLVENDCTITLIEGDSGRVKYPSNSCDFSITSPPYWDLEYYGDEPEQLGKNKTYQGFLEAITRQIKETYRILKPGSYVCWCINDFVKDGIYYAYHADLIPIFQAVGFKLHVIYITDLTICMGHAFIQTILKTKRFPKRHEYSIVFKKGE